MLNLPNIISLARIPLLLLFFQENPIYRAIGIFLAVASDGLDGFIARKFQQTTKLGALLDPITDKLFVFVTLGVFIHEDRLNLWQAMAMISRDFSVILFGIYLAANGYLGSYKFRAIWCGKVITFLQFSVLLGINFHFSIPSYVFISFILLGFLALFELSVRSHRGSTSY